mgnify:FL=1
MKLTKLKLSELKKPEKNVRIHSEKQIKEFRRSLEMFDQIRPIVVDENYTILAGNGLYAALVSMGKAEADCYIIKGLSDKEKKKLMLADNKIFGLGIDDMEVFETFLAELGDDLDIPGFETELLETLTANANDADDMMSGYGIISEGTKEQIAATAQRYESDDAAHAETADEVKVAPRPEPTQEPEKLPQKFVICPKCGERLWL